MPVGAGSIRRVAKAAAIEPAKVVAPVEKEEAVEKTNVKKTTVAKTTSKKTTTKPSSTKVTNTSEYNKVCHITEELPIYLL